MMLELDEKAKGILKDVLQSYLSDLREEKFKKDDPPLQEKEQIIKRIIDKIT